MKHLLFILLLSFCSTTILGAQQNEIKKRPFYDYEKLAISNADTIPDYSSKSDKLKITGTIFESDGITPAKDVILHIYQADENGDFITNGDSSDSKKLLHRAWIKTNEDGQYTLYTFVPNTDIRNRSLREIHTVIKQPNKQPETIASFLFDNDPYLNKSCRKKTIKEDAAAILFTKKENGLLTASRDITLKDSGLITKK